MEEKLFSDPYTGMNDPATSPLQQAPSSSFSDQTVPISVDETGRPTEPAFGFSGVPAGVGLSTPPQEAPPEVVSAVPPGSPAAAPAEKKQPYLTPRARASMQAHDAHRKANLEEVKTLTTALEHGVGMLDQMPEGEARTKFIEAYAGRLESVSPGMGDTFRAVAAKPVLLTEYQKYMPYLTEPMKVMAQTRPRDFLKFVGTAEGQTQLEKARERSLLEGPTGATTKARTIITHFQQLAPPEMAEKFNKDGRVTVKEIHELNEYLTAQGSPAALSQEQLNAANRAGDAFWTPLGILSPKHEQEAMAQAAKDKLKAGQIVDIPLGGTDFAKGVYDPDNKLFPGTEHNAQGFAILGKGKKEGTKLEFPPTNAEVIRMIDGKQHKFKVSISGDGKVQETDLGEVAPAPKEKSPIAAIIDEALKDKEKKPAAEAPKAEPKVSAIDIAKQFNVDPKMKGMRMGKDTPRGYEVLDAAGKVVGYYGQKAQ